MTDCLKSDLQEAARYFFGRYELRASGPSSGFSGSGFAHVKASSGEWCLRRWQSGLEERHLRLVHQILVHCRANGFAGVPELATTGEGDTVLRLDGRLFDAQEWLAGEPLSGEPVWEEPTPNVVQSLQSEMLVSLATSLARFHQSAAGLRPRHLGESLSLSRLLEEVAGETSAHGDALAAAIREHAGVDRHAGLRWLELLPEAAVLAERTLKAYPEAAQSVSTLCHGDLWAAHVHFDGTRFVGFTDFEQLHFGSAVSDLAQLILHFNGWSEHAVVVDAYQKVSPLENEDRAMLAVAAAIDLVFEGCWALNLLYGRNDFLSPRQKAAHETNLHALLESLELIVTDLKRGCTF